MSFVHLHVHTEFSLLDGMTTVDELVDVVKADEQTAVAQTDHGVLYGSLRHYKACTAAGIKPLLGCEVYVAPAHRGDKETRTVNDGWNYHLILLAMSDVGWRNLVTLVTRATYEGMYYKPRVDRELLEEYNEGLICLSGCLGSELAQQILRTGSDSSTPWIQTAQWYANVFHDRYFLELQEHGQQEDQIVRDGLLNISQRKDVPIVATQDSHYTRREDASLHELLLAMQTGSRMSVPVGSGKGKRFAFKGSGFHVATQDEMSALFSHWPEAISNTQYVADMCSVTIETGGFKLPRFEVPQ